jgi:iron complex outermembrane recepter protein
MATLIDAGRFGIFASLIAAQVAALLPSGARAADQAIEPANPSALQEVIVTAQKKSERLQDVPTAVTAISVESLEATHSLKLQDYFATVPGLAINDTGGGEVSLVIRGLSTSDGNNPTVGVTIDDVPIGPSNTGVIGGAVYTPELDPADLQRIEVLKGPQGTLYGASTLGGLLKYVTTQPDLTGVRGRVEADVSTVEDGGTGSGGRASLSAPLVGDSLAMSIAAFDRLDPGFIQDPSQDRSNVNTVHVNGYRAALLWQIAPNATFTVADLVQNMNGDGYGTVDTNINYQPVYGDLEHEHLRGSEEYNYSLHLLTGNLNVHLQDVDIVSVTGYQIDRVWESFYFPSYNDFYPGTDAMLYNEFETVKWTQELRISSAGHRKFDWLVGGFFTNENNGDTDEPVDAINPATGQNVGEILNYYYPDHYEEWAGFADLTYHITDKLDLQLGGRESTNVQGYHEEDSGPAIGPVPNVINQASRDTAFTYLLTSSYRPTDALMVYERIASGYRPGGPNTLVTGVDVPPTYQHDTTRNYEVGMKTELFDRRMTLDAAAFYVAWSNIQVQILNVATGTVYNGNAGTAKSAGVELAVALMPIEGLTINVTGNYDDAILTQTVASLGNDGDRLPYSAKTSLNLSAEDKFPITSQVQGFVGASVTRVGNRIGDFTGGPGQLRLDYPAYTTVDLHAGVDVRKFTINAYVRNVGNERGILSSTTREGVTYDTPGAIFTTAIITPRTVGVSLSKEF